MAFTSDDERWFLVNASPDVRQQILATPALHPRGQRTSPIAGVILTNADIDHVAGLLTLREAPAFTLYATRTVIAMLAENPILRPVLHAVRCQPLVLDQPLEVGGGVRLRAFAVPGKVPLWMEGRQEPCAEDCIGLRVEALGSGAMVYVSSCAAVEPELLQAADGAELLFFDGTLWRDDELVRQGLGCKTGRRMGHVSIDGPDGALAAWADRGGGRKVFIHLNNSNPVLIDRSPERCAVERAGWSVAKDGEEFRL